MLRHCSNECKKVDNRCDEAARNVWGAKYTGLSGSKLEMNNKLKKCM